MLQRNKARFQGLTQTLLGLFLVSPLLSTQSWASQPGQLLLPQGSILETESTILNLDRYQPTEKANYTHQSSLRLTTQINNIAPDTTLQLQALQGNVWVYVQYFTDMDGDGIYEWVTDSEGTPYWDVLTKDGLLEPSQTLDQSPEHYAFQQEEIRSITASQLYDYGIAELISRGERGEFPLENVTMSFWEGTIFCLSFSNQPYFGTVTAPEDVPQPEEGETSEGESLEGETPEGETPEGETSEGETSEGETPEGESASGESDAVGALEADLLVVSQTEPVQQTLSDSESSLSYYLKIEPLGWNPPAITGAGTFTDVAPWDWYYYGVDYAVKNGFFFGLTADTFAPDNTMTRAMAIQTLYGFAGKPTVVEASIADVDRQAWYYAACCWGVNNGIVLLDDSRVLAPDAPITRQELVGYLYQYAENLGISMGTHSNLNAYQDASQIDAAYRSGVIWAVERGLLAGDPYGNLSPQGTATRSQTALILTNFVERVLNG